MFLNIVNRFKNIIKNKFFFQLQYNFRICSSYFNLPALCEFAQPNSNHELFFQILSL